MGRAWTREQEKHKVSAELLKRSLCNPRLESVPFQLNFIFIEFLLYFNEKSNVCNFYQQWSVQ